MTIVTPQKMQQTFVLRSVFLVLGHKAQNSRHITVKLWSEDGKTCAKKWQNLCHKAAKVCTVCSNLFCSAHQKNSICTSKIAFVLQKQQLFILSQVLANFLNFQHTFWVVCCCHETGLKLVLLLSLGANLLTHIEQKQHVH